MYKKVYFEISGTCNAKCKYCFTGRLNLAGGGHIFVDINEFKKSIDYMLSKNFITNDVFIALHSWGEPFLHPNFIEIFDYLAGLDLSFGLSTNASYPVFFGEANAPLKHLKIINFSMPGFSQESYDKIHGFDFNKIKSNIVKIIKNIRQCGFEGTALMSYHLYQFNLGEMDLAANFCAENNIIFVPYCASFNDPYLLQKYLKNELNYEELKSCGEELLLHGIKKRLLEFQQSDINNFCCPQYNYLVISEHCNVLTCCGYSDTDENAVLKKIYNVNDIEEVNIWRKSSKICRECIESGNAYIGQNPVFYHDLFNQPYGEAQLQLVSLKNSTSWKITRPLRIIKIIFRSVLKKLKV